jgi:hypothetical protein
VPLPRLPLPPQPLQPRAATLLEALLQRPVPLGPPTLDPLPPSTLGTLPLEVLALEPLRDRLAFTPQRNDVGVTSAEATRWHRAAVRSRIGDAIVPCEPHPAGGSAASEAL